MKKFNILIATSVVALLATGCVKPTQDNQAIYNETPAPQGAIYEDAQPIVYAPATTGNIYAPATTGDIYAPAPVGTIYEEVQADGTVITPSGGGEVMTGGVTYPDPYANNGSMGSVYNDPYASQPVITNYPVSSPAPVVGGQTGGIQLQIAALKEYFTAEDYKNRLSLAPGLSAYVQRGAMNKVIVTGIPSIAEANRLKETRFPGAFIVHGASTGGYTPSVQPNYDTTMGGGAYNINNPYGVASSSNVSGNSGIGVQVGAFGSMRKAQSVANNQSGRYPATVKKIGKYYKVILTGFTSRSAAKAHAGRVGGFVVSVY